MVYPPLWLWLLALVVTCAGFFFSRPLNALIARLPSWLCLLLFYASLVGLWLALNAQFGGLVLRFSLP